MDLGSCQYESIGDTIDNCIEANLGTQTLMRKYPEIDFTNVKTWDEIKTGLKDELRDQVLDEEINEDDEEERKEREFMLGSIDNIETMDDFFICTCNSSWDLWSACSFIQTELGIVVQEDNVEFAGMSSKYYGLLLYYYYKNNMVQDMDVYSGFDT